MVSPLTKVRDDLAPMYTHRHLQTLQEYLDKTNQAKMALLANCGTIISLHDFYSNVQNNNLFDLRHDCEDALNRFKLRLEDLLSDVELQVTRATSLAREVSETQIRV